MRGCADREHAGEQALIMQLHQFPLIHTHWPTKLISRAVTSTNPVLTKNHQRWIPCKINPAVYFHFFQKDHYADVLISAKQGFGVDDAPSKVSWIPVCTPWCEAFVDHMTLNATFVLLWVEAFHFKSTGSHVLAMACIASMFFPQWERQAPASWSWILQGQPVAWREDCRSSLLCTLLLRLSLPPPLQRLFIMHTSQWVYSHLHSPCSPSDWQSSNSLTEPGTAFVLARLEQSHWHCIMRYFRNITINCIFSVSSPRCSCNI